MTHLPQPSTDDTGVAISVTGLSKKFHIYDRPQDRLLQILWRGRKQLYREFRALDDISFDIYRGETVGIVGLNGSGKSTLLQLIAGTLAPSEGEVRVCGRVSALLELGAGFNPEFTGHENIFMAASIMGLSHAETLQRYERIVAFADIGDFVQQPVKTYSSGMYVRLAFAVAISMDPDVLIVDEALAVGDMGFQAKCMVTLKQMQERGTTILFVSHDISAVGTLCQRAIYLKQGKMLALGAASEIATRYIREVQEANNRMIATATADPETPDALGAGAAIRTPATSREDFLRFAKMAEHGRSGTGDARIMFAEMLDENGSPLASAVFEQPVRIRIVVEAVRKCSFSVNYKICDKNRMAIIGADFLMQNRELLALKPGQQAEIIYKTALPLNDGKYSLRISLTQPIDAHVHAVFYDIVEIAHVFEVVRHPTAKFWTHVYLPNTLDVTIS